VGYYVVDEGLGLSFNYAAGGMNGNLYTGGYYKGHYASVGVTDSGEVPPAPSATLWGDVNSDVQNLFVAETNAHGKMTKSWSFAGTGIQSGSPGHGAIVNRVQVDGITSMLDNAHLAVKGDFSAQVTLPDGTLWSQGRHTDGSVRKNTKDNVQFVMKLDVSSKNGTGAGTTGWARMLDEDHNGVTIHAGGVHSSYVTDVHGDTNGDMILTYTGYSDYNASIVSYDRYGRASYGAMTGPTHYLMKLSATDGSEVWRHAVPKALSECTPINDGSFFCGYTMRSSDGAVDFGNGQIMPAVTATTSGILHFDSSGVAQKAWATHEAPFMHMGLSPDGSLMAITGDGGRGNMDLLSRIHTSTGSVLWTDTGSGGGTHGFRGVAVHSDGTQVTTFGQISEGAPLTLTDSEGSETIVTSRGSYTVWVAAYDAFDGTGKWALDAGSDGLDYFFAFGIDTSTNDIYAGGGVYDTPENFMWGDVKRPNVMRQYAPSADISGYVGTTKGFTAQIKSTTTRPSCLDTCSSVVGPQASDVKTGHCYINRHCYAEGEFAPYPGSECRKCDPTTSAGRLAWSAPDTSSMCFIGGSCIAQGAHKMVRQGYYMRPDACLHCDTALSTTDYSAVKGCLLPSEFEDGCYEDTGEKLMTLATMESLNATQAQKITQLKTEKATITTTMNGQKAALQTQLDNEKAALSDEQAAKALVEADLQTCTALKEKAEDEADDTIPTYAIALLAAFGALFLLVFVFLIFIVMKEKSGAPIFVPMSYSPKSVQA
jgi:hypothetical protein